MIPVWPQSKTKGFREFDPNVSDPDWYLVGDRVYMCRYSVSEVTHSDGNRYSEKLRKENLVKFRGFYVHAGQAPFDQELTIAKKIRLRLKREGGPHVDNEWELVPPDAPISKNGYPWYIVCWGTQYSLESPKAFINKV